jgi:hypothetical protein
MSLRATTRSLRLLFPASVPCVQLCTCRVICITSSLITLIFLIAYLEANLERLVLPTVINIHDPFHPVLQPLFPHCPHIYFPSSKLVQSVHKAGSVSSRTLHPIRFEATSTISIVGGFLPGWELLVKGGQSGTTVYLVDRFRQSYSKPTH